MKRWSRFAGPAGARSSGFRRRVPVALAALGLVSGTGSPGEAAELKPETIVAWEQYVASVEARLAREGRSGDGFLGIDFSRPVERASIRGRIRRGEIFVENVAGDAVDVEAGTISHWRGYVFVPGVTLDEILDRLSGPDPGRAHRQEDVLEARVLDRQDDSLRLFLKLQRKAIVTVAYNTEHRVSFERHAPQRASSRSVSTRIAELEDAGTPHEREKPVGRDRGFMWRLHSYWRYEAMPGGVMVELESLTLSRDVPWALRAIAGPLIDRIARESMTRTLSALRTRWPGPPRASAGDTGS
jgi:hypothetical protein